jgi:hypothetical protein
MDMVPHPSIEFDNMKRVAYCDDTMSDPEMLEYDPEAVNS